MGFAALYGGPRIDLRQVDSDRTIGSRADVIRRAVSVFTQLPLNLGLRVLAHRTLVQHGGAADDFGSAMSSSSGADRGRVALDPGLFGLERFEHRHEPVVQLRAIADCQLSTEVEDGEAGKDPFIDLHKKNLTIQGVPAMARFVRRRELLRRGWNRDVRWPPGRHDRRWPVI